MTHDLKYQIEDMTRTVALLQEARRLNGNRGYGSPIRQALFRLEELRKRAAGGLTVL
ncbi:hypothetical protein [Agrobacterium tumefaciens]|uniref:hypothetical protein n=1 Tax=Agrobacterium tumefaciens TaxID=358 RepID=UPI003BA2C796